MPLRNSQKSFTKLNLFKMPLLQVNHIAVEIPREEKVINRKCLMIYRGPGFLAVV